jgi:uncharacterized nucleotidyltransferase DUF6036
MADKLLHQDFVDLLRAFAAADVRFLVVGAYALALHGLPRATGDLDVWIDPTPANARRAYGALRDFGTPLANLREEDLTNRDLVFQMGVAPVRIDVLMSISGVVFDEAWKRRTEAVFEGVRFPVIGLDDLVQNKRACGRPKDLVDLEILERQRRR